MKRCARYLLAIWLVATTAVGGAQQADDPMRPSYVKTVRHASRQARQSWQLQGVMGTDQQRIAVVNGRVVEVGDLVMGAVVTRIGPAAVDFRMRSRRWTIRMPQAAMGEKQ